MSDSLEEQQFKSWLRRPTLFIANAWYLMAAAGQTVVPYALIFILQLIGRIFPFGLAESTIIYTASTLQQVLVLALPVVLYAARHDGVDQAMRLNPPRLDMMLYAVTAALFGVMLSNCISLWWMLLVESLGGWLYASSIPVPTNADELTTAIAGSGAVIATRFHAAILALAAGRPVLPVVYSDKTIHVLEDLDFEGPVYDLRRAEEWIWAPGICKAPRKEAEGHFARLDKQLEEI